MQLNSKFGIRNSEFGIQNLLFIIILLLIVPLNLTLAESQHFNLVELKEETSFLSGDGGFKLTIPAGEYQEPLDVYLFELDNSLVLNQINALTPIYSYYIYSNEVTADSELSLTLAYNGDHREAKTVYYLNQEINRWQMASNKAFVNNLTFKIKGKKNKLVIAGTNLAESSKQDAKETAEIAEQAIYSFKANSELSELESREVCLPYLINYFKTSASNTKNEVEKLQTFLREYEGFSELPTTGFYGPLTYNAVSEFQEKYKEDILTPWGISKGTGWVLETTLNKINQLYCEKYNQADKYYEIAIPYKDSSKKAKSAYYLENEGTESENWAKLESFDDYRNKIVTAIIDKDSAKISLFEEDNAWVGKATWYSWKGGNFAASRDFPKGTKLKITNQSSGGNRGKSVIVTINDYGPELHTEAIIDLDKVAFGQIGDLRAGVMAVKIEVVH